MSRPSSSEPGLGPRRGSGTWNDSVILLPEGDLEEEISDDSRAFSQYPMQTLKLLKRFLKHRRVSNWSFLFCLNKILHGHVSHDRSHLQKLNTLYLPITTATRVNERHACFSVFAKIPTFYFFPARTFLHVNLTYWGPRGLCVRSTVTKRRKITMLQNISLFLSDSRIRWHLLTLQASSSKG